MKAVRCYRCGRFRRIKLRDLRDKPQTSDVMYREDSTDTVPVCWPSCATSPEART